MCKIEWAQREREREIEEKKCEEVIKKGREEEGRKKRGKREKMRK